MAQAAVEGPESIALLQTGSVLMSMSPDSVEGLANARLPPGAILGSNRQVLTGAMLI